MATGRVSVDAPVAQLATVPALTIDEDATQAAGLLCMVEHGVHHLVVTDQSSRPVSVVRVVDLAQAEVRDPLLVRSAIEGSTSLDELARAARLLPGTLVELSDNRVAAGHIGAVHAAVVDAVVRRVLDLHHSPALAAARHSWVPLGSLARKEPLPLSDLDTRRTQIPEQLSRGTSLIDCTELGSSHSQAPAFAFHTTQSRADSPAQRVRRAGGNPLLVSTEPPTAYRTAEVGTLVPT